MADRITAPPRETIVLRDLLERWARETPDAPCAVFDDAAGARTTTWSWAEMLAQVQQTAAALQRLEAATQAAWATGQPEDALANATPYLQAFGHVVLAWLWLDVALAAQGESDFARGKQAAQRYFFTYELPKIGAWLAVAASREPVARDMQDAWF